MACSKIDLRNPIVHYDNAAREYLESVSWREVQFARAVASGAIGSRRWSATGKVAGKTFSVMVRTVVERFHIPLSKWVLAIRLMAASKKGFSALSCAGALAASGSSFLPLRASCGFGYFGARLRGHRQQLLQEPVNSRSTWPS